MANAQVEDALSRSIQGLKYMSESDEPFKVVEWQGDGKPMDANKLLQLSGNDPDTPVSTVPFDDFFKDLTTVQPWYGNDEKTTVQRYKDLEQTLRSNLSDLQVFRVGEVHVAIYIVGQTTQGDWAGVKTMSIET